MISIVEAPVNSGQPKPDVSTGAEMLWKKLAPYVRETDQKNHVVLDIAMSDDLPRTGTDVPKSMAPMMNVRKNGDDNKKISNAVLEELSKNSLCLTLGGDHSFAIGSVYGHSVHASEHGAEVVILWIDAHADINTPAVSPSGNIHGMPLAFNAKELVDLMPNKIPGFEWLKHPRINLRNLAYIGLRDVDEGEKAFLKSYNIKSYYAEDVRAVGIEEAVKDCLAYLNPGPKRSLHLSYDIDAMDPSIAPSTGTVVPDGLTMTDGIHIMEECKKTGHLDVIDMAEVNPGLGTEDDARITVDTATKLLLVGAGLCTKEDMLKRIKN
ncbi:arginase, hepatic-like [Lineus longissimus]|uniref:arginase, hepatic-like n=1 Tax=Lineus longissimus TaxID=88925 RepID=UPI00315D0380